MTQKCFFNRYLRKENLDATMQATTENWNSNVDVMSLRHDNVPITNQIKDGEYKLQDQISEVTRLATSYKDLEDLESKIKSAGTCKANGEISESIKIEINKAVTNAKKLLHVISDKCGILARELKASEDQFEIDLAEKDVIIAQLKLKLASSLQKRNEGENTTTTTPKKHNGKEGEYSELETSFNEIHDESALTIEEKLENKLTELKHEYDQYRDEQSSECQSLKNKIQVLKKTHRKQIQRLEIKNSTFAKKIFQKSWEMLKESLEQVEPEKEQLDEALRLLERTNRKRSSSKASPESNRVANLQLCTIRKRQFESSLSSEAELDESTRSSTITIDVDNPKKRHKYDDGESIKISDAETEDSDSDSSSDSDESSDEGESFTSRKQGGRHKLRHIGEPIEISDDSDDDESDERSDDQNDIKIVEYKVSNCGNTDDDDVQMNRWVRLR